MQGKHQRVYYVSQKFGKVHNVLCLVVAVLTTKYNVHIVKRAMSDKQIDITCYGFKNIVGKVDNVVCAANSCNVYHVHAAKHAILDKQIDITWYGFGNIVNLTDHMGNIVESVVFPL